MNSMIIVRLLFLLLSEMLRNIYFTFEFEFTAEFLFERRISFKNSVSLWFIIFEKLNRWTQRKTKYHHRTKNQKRERERDKKKRSNRRIGLIKTKARRNYSHSYFPKWTGRIIRKIITTKVTSEDQVSKSLSFFLPSFLSLFSLSLPFSPSPHHPLSRFNRASYFFVTLIITCSLQFQATRDFPARVAARVYVYTRLPI